MTLGLIFWILMLLWLIFGLWWSWPGAPGQPTSSGYGYLYPIGNTVLLFILFLLLGWAVFGAPVRG